MAVLSLESAGPYAAPVRRALASARLDSCVVPPFAMAAGVILYFLAPWAAPPALLLTLIGAGLAGRWAAARYLWRSWPRWCAALLAWAAIGYGAAGWRTWDVAAPVMADTDRGWTVEGWVSRVDPGDRVAATIVVSSIAGLAPEQTPARVRVRLLGETPSLGQGVRVRAGLSPPPGPSAPGDHDFSRQAYFDRIGATGFTYGAAEPAEVSGGGALRAVARMRGALADHIRARAPDHRGGILAALVTGERSGVDARDSGAMRDSGIYHMLAISGMHMSLVGGVTFAACLLMLALISPLSRAWDMRKPAAAAALLVCSIYLVVSGAYVSAVRAYIMIAVMFGALLVDRRALTLRNIAIAATVVLLIAPESLFEAGFQMSFAATAALIAGYEWLRERRLVAARERSAWAWTLRLFGGLTFASTVAGASSGVIAAFHFNRTANFGLLGNLLAVPVFDFWVMPLLLLASLLTPLGLDGPFWSAAAAGMGLILWVGDVVAALPGAVSWIPGAPPYVLAIYGAGFIALCAGRGAVRAGGLAAMLGACALWAAAPRPLLWVSDTAVVTGAADGVLYVSDLRRSRYGTDRFAQRTGLGADVERRHFREIAGCDSAGCLGWLNGVLIAAPLTRGAVTEDCAEAELVAFRDRVSNRLRESCGALLLDGRVLDQQGPALIFRARDGGLSARHAGETTWRPPYGAGGGAGIFSRTSAPD